MQSSNTADTTISNDHTQHGSDYLRNMTLLLVSTLTVMAGATIAPSLPAMADKFSSIQHIDFWVQMAMTLPGLAITLSAPFIGRYVDTYDKKLLLLISVISYGVLGTAAMVVSHSLSAILVLRFLLGISVAGIMVTCTTLFSDYYAGPKRGHYLGLQAAFGGFGGVVFIATANSLAGANWLYPFALYGLAFLTLPAIMLWVVNPKKIAAPQPISMPQANAQPQTAPLNATKHNTQPRDYLLWGCCALAIVEILALYTIPVHLPFYLQALNTSAAANAQYSGYFIALMLLVMAVTASQYHRFQPITSIHRLHAGGFGIIALGFIFWATSQQALLDIKSPLMGQLALMAILIVLGFGLGVIRPNLITWLMSRCPPEQRGQKMGKLTSCFFIGQFITPIATLPLLSIHLFIPTEAVTEANYTLLFTVLGGLCLLAAMGCLYWGKDKP